MEETAAPGRRGTILRIIARLNTGGPSLHTVILTRELNPGRFVSHLITGRIGAHEGDMRYYADAAGVKPLIIDELTRDVGIVRDVRALYRLLRVIHRLRPDLIHTHTTKAGLLGRLAGLLYNIGVRFGSGRRIRLVHTYHGHVFDGYLPRSLSKILVFVERLLALGTDRLITVSEGVKRELVERYRICPLAKMEVIAPGLDLSWSEKMPARSDGLRAKFGVDASVITIGMVGRLTAIKNPELLLAAMTLFWRDDMRALFVGGGELLASLQRKALENGLMRHVVFTGWQHDPANIYGAVDIACVTSRNEGTPVALIEAMAAGRPFVATEVGGIPDLMVGKPERDAGFDVFENGILVRSNDAAALAAALEYLVKRPEKRARMGAVGRRDALMKFSKQRMLSEMEDLYAKALNGQ